MLYYREHETTYVTVFIAIFQLVDVTKMKKRRSGAKNIVFLAP